MLKFNTFFYRYILPAFGFQKTKPISFFQKIGRISWFQKPTPFWHRAHSDQTLILRLAQAQNTLTLKEFRGVNEFFYLLSQISFWGIIWFYPFSLNTFLGAFGAIFIAYKIPHLWLSFKIRILQKKLETDVPYFIDLVSLMVGTGMNLEQALYRVSKDKSDALSQIIAKELRRLKLEHNIEKMLLRLKNIILAESFQPFISSLMQSKKLGVSLTHMLEIQSKMIRTYRLQKAESIGRTASVKMSLPLVLFIFPALLLIYIGPGILSLL